jgi:hypothetical protein
MLPNIGDGSFSGSARNHQSSAIGCEGMKPRNSEYPVRGEETTLFTLGRPRIQRDHQLPLALEGVSQETRKPNFHRTISPIKKREEKASLVHL